MSVATQIEAHPCLRRLLMRLWGMSNEYDALPVRDALHCCSHIMRAVKVWVVRARQPKPLSFAHHGMGAIVQHPDANGRQIPHERSAVVVTPDGVTTLPHVNYRYERGQ